MNTITKNIILAPLNLVYFISPATSLKILFRLKNGHTLNVKNPKTYNEKLQWVKLNYKNPLLTKLVDKYTVRDFVEERAPELLTTLYWQGFSGGDIPWDELPEKFVIKATHGSGFNIICKEKKNIDKAVTVETLDKWLRTKFLRCYGEWFYGVEKPRIIVEEFLDNGTGHAPEDYKIMCFDGKAEYIIVDTDRFVGHKRNLYDASWNFLEDVSMDFPNDRPMPRPANLDELIKYAEILSEGFPHVRVDLYDVNGKIYFGEMTFTNGSGFDRIIPHEFDLHLGDLFKLSAE